MIKLSDTQLVILSAAAQREDRIALPLPESLRGGAAAKVVGTMLAKGFLEEIDAHMRKGEPVWRETGDGHGVTLVATDAGLAAIGIEPENTNPEPSGANEAQSSAPATEATDQPKPVTIRAGTKQAQVIALLQRPEGASVAEIVEATSWQPHTARGMISGALKKKLGLQITSAAEEGRGTVHRIG
ncbi:DUF3489 domain-containing protein [Ostreiculturibacter nitratireducens]|uniref:DUF3489 domain-containing protein n=1 Tax=Ostreiculturibacter nitratireducens TaxID=3075226 RepID=UPI0031B5D7A7